MSDTTHYPPDQTGQQSGQPQYGPGGVQHGSPSHDHTHQRKERVSFSPEELRAIKECSRESFWYRCVPLSIAFVGATQFAIKAGYLKSKGTFGGIGKNIVAIVAGFVLGKVSYQGACRRKIMALPNSRLAEAMRTKGKLPELYADMTGLDAFRKNDDHGLQTDYNPSLDLDPDRRTHHTDPEGLNDSNRPNLDNSAVPQDRHEPGKTQTSYDDLRKQNRDDHNKRVMDSVLRRSSQSPSSSAPPPGAPPSQQQQQQQQPLMPPPPPPSSSSSYQASILSQSETKDAVDEPSKQRGHQPRKIKNKYGDVIE